MRRVRDLDRVDLATLQIWRVSNIVGWWLAGASAYSVVSIVLGRTFVQKVAYETTGLEAPIALIGVLAFASATAGGIVGAHVYRAPLAVGAETVLVPWAFVVVLSLVDGNLSGAPMDTAYVILAAALSSAVATITWRHRPSSLRTPRSR